MAVEKIIARLFGGVGNQLFIYASSRSFALRYNAELYLDIVSGFAEDRAFERQFTLDRFSTVFKTASAAQRLEPFSKLRRRLSRISSQVLSPALSGYVYDPATEFNERSLHLPNRRTVHLEGYWQSYKYFLESDLRRELTILPPADTENLSLAEKVASSPSTAVHMRFFEEYSSTQIEVLEQYYRGATEALSKLRGSTHFYVFSDNPQRAAESAKRIWCEDFTIVTVNNASRNAYADMWLMSRCNNNIIADSTFSWWGAWFNSEPARLVFAPRRSLSGRDSAWNTESLIPKDWILV